MKSESKESPLISKKNKFLQMSPKIFQLVEIYNPTKHDIKILIYQLIYLFLILSSFIVGISLIIPKLISPLFHDINSIIENWNNTNSKEFRLLNIKLLSQNESFLTFSINKSYLISYPYYNLLYYPENFYLNNISFLGKKEIKENSNLDSKNLTVNISIIIDENLINLNNINLMILLNEQNSSLDKCMKKKGNYNDNLNQCKLVYYLKNLCIIIDSNIKKLYENYKLFLCDNYTNWYENLEVIPWNETREPNIKDFIEYNNFKIIIGDIHEPYIWLSFQDKLINYSEIEDSYLGMILLFINIILIIGVLVLYIFKQNFKEQFLKNEQMEMNDKGKEIEEQSSSGEENENKTKKIINKNEKGIPVPNPILK